LLISKITYSRNGRTLETIFFQRWMQLKIVGLSLFLTIDRMEKKHQFGCYD